MKNLKSKKSLALLLAVMVLVVAAGVTYAWFTVRSETASARLALGNIGVSSEFVVDDEDVLLEPGLAATVTGSVKNTGTLALAAKLESNSTVTVYRDAQGNPIVGGSPAPAEDDFISIDIDITNMVPEDIVEIDGEYCYYAWLYDRNNPSDLYLYCDPKIAQDLVFDIVISEETGVRYMDAVINVSNGWTATQMIPDAIRSDLGVNPADLGYISELQINAGRMARAANFDSKHSMIVAWVEDQFDRG